MDRPPFGQLRARGGAWHGSAPLPRFAELSAVTRGDGAAYPLADDPVEPEVEAKLLADMQQALDGVKARMREQYGPEADALLEAMDREMAEGEAELARELSAPPSARRLEREQKQAERAAKRAAADERRRLKRARGLMPFELEFGEDEDGEPLPESPSTPEQEAAFRWLTERPDAAFEQLRAQVWASFTYAYGQDYWRDIAGLKPAASLDDLAGQWAVAKLTVTRGHHAGAAYLVFGLDATWKDDHGLCVVCHPAKDPQWTTYDGLYDLTLSDDQGDEEDEEAEEVEESTPESELLAAIFAGDDRAARRLYDQGARVQDDAEFSPLCDAVEGIQLEQVRRLLQYGADPTRPPPGGKRTPLQIARRAWKDMGFDGQGQDGMMQAVLRLAANTPDHPMHQMKADLAEIIRLLEEAGAGK